MKHKTLAVAILLSMVYSASILAQAQAESKKPVETVKPSTQTTTVNPPVNPVPPYHMPGMGMKHRGKHHHGKGHGGMKHGGSHKGKGHHEKHRQMVQRLDMIEARLAKIEAMLEILVRR